MAIVERVSIESCVVPAVGGEERVGRGGGVERGAACVEVETLHGEVAARTVHQAGARVEDLQHRTCR